MNILNSEVLHYNLQKCLYTLQNGGTILYPTDTVWGLGCDATNTQAVSRIYEIKQRQDSKALIVLMSDLVQLRRYVQHIPPLALELLAKSKKPTTIIYKHIYPSIAPNLLANDGSLAVRLVKNDFCQALLQAFGKPLVSTSANLSGKPTPSQYHYIENTIIESCDFVVSPILDTAQNNSPSSILRIDENDNIEIIRA